MNSKLITHKAIALLALLMLALFAALAILAAGNVGPDVSIVSPADGVATAQVAIEVEVAFRASANSKKAKTTGNVSTVILLVNGVEVDRYENPRNIKEGTHTFQVDLSAFPDSNVTLQACSYQGNVKAGHSTCSATPSVVVDRTPPEITGTIAPEPNANDWNSGPVTVSFAATDAGSVVANVTPNIALTSEGANQFVVGTATDVAGNSAMVNVTVNIDATAPVATITSPADGSTTGEETVTLQASLSDSLSGLGEVRVIHNGVVVQTQALGGVASFDLSTPITLADDENVIAVEADDLAHNTDSDAVTVTKLCGGTPPAIITFDDPILEAAVRLRLNKPTGDFTPSDIPLLTSLNASSKSITDLSGLEWFTDLTNLSLHSNQISDLTPLKCLTNLRLLDLRYNNLISDISPLAAMTEMTQLYLTRNQITDISHLAGMTKLTELWLDSNLISNISYLSAMTELRHLFLGSNQITDTSALSGLTKITWLTLYLNQIGDLDDLDRMTNLRRLRAYSAQISDISGIGGVSTTMRFLDLRYNNLISDVSPLAAMTEMTQLYLTQNKISDISHLAGMTKLTELWLDSNLISNISYLSAMTELRHLFLGSNQITDTSALSGLTKITWLTLYLNQIGDLDDLDRMTNLRQLRAYSAQISDISGLTGITTLQTLDVRFNPIPCNDPIILQLQQGGTTVSC